MTQAGDDGGLDQGETGRDGEKRSDLYIFQGYSECHTSFKYQLTMVKSHSL